MVDIADMVKLMEETRNGCDHNCESCEMFLPARDECFHIASKKWEEWNTRRREQLGKILRGEE